MPRYRISIDDNIEFLRDLTAGDYARAFDNEYLGFIEYLHDRYGACFCINLFYDNYASRGFEPKNPDFCLDDMTDRYRADFAAASDWLKFSFHAKAEYPAPPYENSGYDEVYADGRAVHAAIERFAGKQSLTNEMTLHWGLCTQAGFKALTDLGYDTFYGYLTVDKNGMPSGSYALDCEFLQKHPERLFTVDGYTFRKTDILLNAYASEEAVERDVLSLLAEGNDFYELMFHEQYFYPTYHRYIARYRPIIERAAAVMYRAGYTGGFLKQNRRRITKNCSDKPSNKSIEIK